MSSISGQKRPREDEQQHPNGAAAAAVAAAAPDLEVAISIASQSEGNDTSSGPAKPQITNLRRMESYHQKRTNDSIHSTIDICPAMQVMMDRHPYFQRLRKLKQLGVTESVYMNATHNRKEHSLGVAHLAERLARRLALRQPKLRITEKDVLCVKLAGLCHDLGHGPFSHVYDGPFLEAMRVEQAAKEELTSSSSSSALSSSNPYAGLPPIPEGWTHEDASLSMIDAILKSNGLEIDLDNLDGPLKQIGDGVDAECFGISSAGDFGFCLDDDVDGGDNGGGDAKPYPKERLLTSRDFIFIKECINGGEPLDNGSVYVGRPDKEKEFLYDIVANRHSGLDVDKIDYFARDQRQCHKGSGEIEVLFIDEAFVAWGKCSRPSKCHCCRHNYEGEEDAQLQRLMRQDADDDGGGATGMEGKHKHLMICYPDKMLVKALEFFKTRFRLHGEIYTHRQAKGAEYMICDILKLADPHFRLRAGPEHPHGLPISRAMVDCTTAYSRLNDTVIDAIRSSTDSRLRPAQDLIERYERRDFYKFVCSIEIRSDVNDDTNRLWDKDEMAIKKELCEMEVCHDAGEQGGKLVLTPDDIIIEKREIHHGRKGLNPVDMMRFLPKNELSRLNRSVYELPDARQQPEEKYKSSIPQCFNQKDIRIFCRSSDEKKTSLLNHTFDQWVSDTKRGLYAPISWPVHMEEDEYIGHCVGGILSQEVLDQTPPRRGIINRNTMQVSVEATQEEASPKPSHRGPTSLFAENDKKNEH